MGLKTPAFRRRFGASPLAVEHGKQMRAIEAHIGQKNVDP